MNEKLTAIEIENAILGGLLKDFDSNLKYMEDLHISLFSDDINKLVFRAISTLQEQAKSIDIVTVFSLIKDKGKLDKLKSPVYLTDLLDNYVSNDNFSDYINILKEKKELRFLEKVSTETHNLVETGKTSVEIKEILFNTLLNSTKDEKVKTASPEEIVALREEGLIDKFLHNLKGTGYTSIDPDLAYGFGEGQLSIIAGRPANGKSLCKDNFIRKQCQNGLSVLNISPEMGFHGEMDRLESLESNVPLQDILHIETWTHLENSKIYSKNHPEKLKRLIEARERISNWKLNFSWGRTTLASVTNDILRVKKLYGLDVVYIDLFDRLAEVRAATSNKPQVITKYVAAFDEIAKTNNIHICLLVQINRAADHRQDKRPTIADLKESGAYEEEAWMVWGIYRPALYDRDLLMDNEIELILLKQRQGVTNKSYKMSWDNKTLEILDELKEEEYDT